MPSTVVLVVDGLGAGHLGPYGNTWIETPAFNRLASESVLAEQAWAPFPDVAPTYDAFWRATHGLGLAAADFTEESLLAKLNSRGVATQLLTDDPDLIDHRWSAEFGEQIELELPTYVGLASRWDQTHTARFFAEAIRAMDRIPSDSLLWLHTRGLSNPWDAPMTYREQFVDEDDPDPTISAEVPQVCLDADYDPDELHTLQCAYAGQIVLLDQCLGGLLASLRETAIAREMLFLMTSTRGFPLGEHLVVGCDHSLLYRELLHVPLLVRYPDTHLAMRRERGLTETRDVTQILYNWFSDQSAKGSEELPFPQRDFSISRSLRTTELLLRTAAWQARFPQWTDDMDGDLAASQLFVKPDDQAEVNDVSNRCADVTEAAWLFLQECVSKATEYDRLRVPDVLREAPH